MDKTGGYVMSRLVLAVLSSIATGVFLWALGVPYWLPLAIWTGVVSQFIPTVGTYLAILVPALIALAAQPMDALWVVAFGVVYQQIEDYLIAPRVTERTVAIHPAVAFGAVIVGPRCSDRWARSSRSRSSPGSRRSSRRTATATSSPRRTLSRTGDAGRPPAATEGGPPEGTPQPRSPPAVPSAADAWKESGEHRPRDQAPRSRRRSRSRRIRWRASWSRMRCG